MPPYKRKTTVDEEPTQKPQNQVNQLRIAGIGEMAFRL